MGVGVLHVWGVLRVGRGVPWAWGVLQAWLGCPEGQKGLQ